ncbi:MAG: hypothetical protein OXH69_19905 [Acidobacteria bacterium]|nr:hypothetical protein [Acidobacteriota bacterium]
MEPAAYSHGYERLRRHAVRPDTEHDRRGLGVVVRRGVAAWLHAFAELPAATCAARGNDSGGTLPDDLRAPLVDILAEMVRGRMARDPA